MTVISGYGGAVNGETGVRQWQIGLKAELSDYGSSNTAGLTSSIEGIEDWSGSYGGYGDCPAALPGESLSFVGSIDGSVGASGTAIVDSVTINCDVEGRKPIEYTVNFSANGALTRGAAAVADASVELPPYAGKVALGTVAAEPTWTDETDVRNWSLTITAANASYASSSTSNATRRVRGNISVTFNYSVYAAGGMASLIAPNTIKGLRLHSTASTYWELLWVLFGDASDLTVNREQVNVVGCSYSGKYRGITLVGSADTKGSIKKPGGATYWPAA